MALDDDLLAGCAVLDHEGLTTAFGHLSARAGEGLVRISGSAGPGLMAEPGDLLTIDHAGTVLDGDPAALAGEAAIHLGIYATHDDVLGVCRFHGPACLAFSTLGLPLRALIGMALFAGDEVPLHDTQTTITTRDQAAALAGTLGSGHAVLLHGFGAVTVGTSVADAVVRAWLLERGARAALDALAAGEPQCYPAGAAVAFDPEHSAAARGQLDRAWNYLKARAR